MKTLKNIFMFLVILSFVNVPVSASPIDDFMSFLQEVRDNIQPLTVYGGNGCYGEYGWRAGRGVSVIYNADGVELTWVDPTTVDSVIYYIWNLDRTGTGICSSKISTPSPTGIPLPTIPPTPPPTIPTVTPLPTTTPAPIIPGFGNINVESSSPGMQIYIDDIPNGITPKTIYGVAAGLHQVTIKGTGYADYTKDVVVLPGSTIEVFAEPARPTPGFDNIYPILGLFMTAYLILRRKT